MINIYKTCIETGFCSLRTRDAGVHFMFRKTISEKFLVNSWILILLKLNMLILHDVVHLD